MMMSGELMKNLYTLQFAQNKIIEENKIKELSKE